MVKVLFEKCWLLLASEVFLVGGRKSEGETVWCRAFPIEGRLLAGKVKLWSRCSASSGVLGVDVSDCGNSIKTCLLENFRRARMKRIRGDGWMDWD